jgi:hypothetical protein
MIISGKQIFIYEGGLFIVLLNPGAKVCGASNETQRHGGKFRRCYPDAGERFTMGAARPETL